MNRVIFRKFSDGQIIALLPDDSQYSHGIVLSYMHVGQHSEADYSLVFDITKPANPLEYFELLDELKRIGYDDLQIRKRANKTNNRRTKK